MNSIPQSKCCTKCGVEKPLDQFPKHSTCKDGHRSYCKTCRKLLRYNTTTPLPIPGGIKTCSTCKVTKPIVDFRQSAVDRSGYEAQCKDCRRASARLWKSKNKDAIRKYEEENRDHLRELRYDWQRRNRDRHLANRRANYRTPKARLYGLLRMHERRVAKNGKVTPDQIRELKARQKKCYYCNKLFTDKLKPTIDHVIPLSKGGQHDISNLVLACKPCNSKKGNRLTRLI